MSSRRIPVPERRSAHKGGTIQTLRVRLVGKLHGETRAYLQVGSIFFKCHLGKHGTAFFKREGDLKTPRGRFTIVGCFFRGDRCARIKSSIPAKQIRMQHIWCDDEKSNSYNQFRTLPLPVNHERLWRDDHQYDFCLPLNYNFSPRIRGRGSAIFLHLSNATGYTAGCIAMNPSALRKTIPRLARKCVIII
jgi:L,D-peptidoglycan transpeptidase YkuD (ErfK/YbiS/YcfS/YnhG family)